MAKEAPIKVKGVVTKALPNTRFIVRLENGEHEINATISGKMRQNSIEVGEGDAVIVEMSIYDLQNGRIVWRGKEHKD